ncbi:hypothetical protein BUALT_Bualt14G0106500 [Buddleja alternifolia]|uniref:Plus3 domain-containing protein n=1 Tax=Buddleja alternifolia TaxID=168488 RepID=A0AAV6WR92_9LAMI|nr:hypothetical protein BUALT_Bualt14G0106500 [Buddleja alternifolia]
MSTSNEDLDLGLALASRSYLVETRLNNNSSGAGVNANSRVDLAFAASDPLSELVWSPHNGLRLKCTESSLADKKPLLLWNVGPSNTALSIRSRGSGDEKGVDEEMLIISHTMLDGDGKFDDKPILVGSSRSSPSRDIAGKSKMEESCTKNATRKEENCEDNGEEDLCSLRNVQIDDIAESSRKIAAVVSSAEQDILADGTHSTRSNHNRTFETSTSTSDEPHATKPSEALPLMKRESSAENNLARPTNSVIHVNREKGKEKALSIADIYGRLSNDEGSHESVESCNSVGVFSKGIKRDSYDHQEKPLGSKRTKIQIQGSHGSMSNFRHDSSFMNWISNMVKCLSDSNKEDSSPIPLSRSNATYKKNYTGNFQTVFQSMYSEKPKICDAEVEKGNYPMQETKEFMVDDKKLIENFPRSCGGGDDKEINPNTNRNIVSQPSNPCTSLWITRYCTRNASPENYNRFTLERSGEKCSSYHGGESSSKGFLNSNEFQKGSGLDLENDLKKNREFLPRAIVTAESAVVPVQMFHAIQNLRLSRTDILRWMSSDVSLPRINGFFLRLRLGKLEAGLGGTGYYIARITDDTKEHIGCKSKKSILVDVGGIKSSIGSQYVSNHDFLEEEINAWWCRTVKTGCKIPSLDELILKFEDRKCLGF